MISEGSCDTEDCSNDAENAFFFKTCCKLYSKLFWQIMILSEVTQGFQHSATETACLLLRLQLFYELKLE